MNHAPFPGFGGWTGGVSSLATPQAQQAMFDFFAFLTRCVVDTGCVLACMSACGLFGTVVMISHDTISASQSQLLGRDYHGRCLCVADAQPTVFDFFAF